MKNMKWIFAGVFSFLAFTLLLSTGVEKQNVTLDILGIETLAYGEELPGIGITCGGPENRGRCWDGECQTTWTPFGWYRAWNCNRATGNPNDFCSDGVPC